MSGLNNREWRELEKLRQKSGYTKLSQAEQRRLERLDGLVSGNRDQVEKHKWVEDRKGRKIEIIPRSQAQAESLKSFERNKVSVSYGAVASGKTAIACWWAANQLVDKKAHKILLCRVNEPLGGREKGFRKGDLLEKSYGWHLPMIEYLSDVFGRKAVDMQIEDVDGYIQIVDWEALRGQTFGRNENESVIVILDEAQLTKIDEIDCFMTRIGEYAKVIMCGDPSPHQRDNKDESGLVYLKQLVDSYDIPDIGFVKYRVRDICRSDFVYDYVIAMQKYHDFDVE